MSSANAIDLLAPNVQQRPAAAEADSALIEPDLLAAGLNLMAARFLAPDFVLVSFGLHVAALDPVVEPGPVSREFLGQYLVQLLLLPDLDLVVGPDLAAENA